MVQTEKGYVREETCHHMIVNDLSVFGAPVFVWPELKNLDNTVSLRTEKGKTT
jgi:hypothetical protein